MNSTPIPPFAPDTLLSPKHDVRVRYKDTARITSTGRDCDRSSVKVPLELDMIEEIMKESSSFLLERR